jgi:hypothetical protein
MSKQKVIIWGYPLDSHTHSYVHGAWYKTFKYLGYETYWFHDDNYPSGFDYSNTIFITEGYAEKNIPIVESSTYFVHICVNPQKYLEKGCRLIDIRFNVNQINDCNYSYEFNKKDCVSIDEVSFYNKSADDSVLSDQFKRGINGYESLYLSWATDLLPEEFNFDDRFISRERKIYHIGSISESNVNEIRKFVHASQENGIEFVHRNPWTNPATWEEVKLLTQKSYIAPDLRGSAMRSEINGKVDTGANHKLIGYIPCRIFKNISYGQIGATNSKSVKQLFGDLVIYNDDEYQLFYDVDKQKNDTDYIHEQMKYVQKNHTYINRVDSIMKVFNGDV